MAIYGKCLICRFCDYDLAYCKHHKRPATQREDDSDLKNCKIEFNQPGWELKRKDRADGKEMDRRYEDTISKGEFFLDRFERLPRPRRSKGDE